MEIKEIRHEIDSLDQEISSLFAKRMALCKKIGEIKQKNGASVTDLARETEILSRLETFHSEYGNEIKELYKKIFEISKEIQNVTKNGLLGKKLGHSYSPEIHRLFGLDNYCLFEKETEKEFIDFLKNENFGFVNITMPYKKTAAQTVDFLSDGAKETGAVNVVIKKNGKLCGYNTDIFGFEYALKKSGISVENKKVLILGSGGACASTLYNMKKAKEVVVVSRNGENNYQNLHLHHDSEIIVNCTPNGMYPGNYDKPLLLLEDFPRLSGVIDWVYNPVSTCLIQKARELNIPCVGGLIILVAQAAKGEELYRGIKISDPEIDEIYEKTLKCHENTVLIGMPGCGKSSIGKTLGRKTQKQVIDIDDEIEKEENKKIPEIFKEKGEEYFRKLETEIIMREATHGGRIIVTGGGAVTKKENIKALKQNGVIFYVERDTNLLESAGRPLSESVGVEELFNQRHKLYEKYSDYKIKNDKTVFDSSRKIAEKFGVKMKPKIMVINGANLNMLGIREKEIYGSQNYAELCDRIKAYAEKNEIDVEITQSNIEGEIVNFIQSTYGKFDGIVLNPGGYTHTSVAIGDAVAAVNIPTVEVHLTDTDLREDYRKISCIRDKVFMTIKGKGIDGYIEAMEAIVKKI